MQRGIKENKGGNIIFISVNKGRFVKRVKEPTENSVSRTLKEGVNAGKEIHEEYFDQIIGAFHDIKVIKSDEYGKFWEFKFDTSTEEKEEFIILKLKYSSGYANNILNRLPSFNYEKDILLKGYNFQPKDKTKAIMGITAYQENANDELKKVIPYYTKETPNGIPEMIKIKVKGEDVWDDTARLEFLENLVNETILPKIKAATGQNDLIATVDPFEVEESEVGNNGSTDNLPF